MHIYFRVHRADLGINSASNSSGSPPNSAHTSAATTPDTASIAEQSDRASSPGGSSDNSDNETSAAVSDPGSVGVKKTNQRDSQLSASSTSTKVAEKPSESSSKGGNLVGKMTNLVTTDLSNYTNASTFVLLVCALLLWLYVVGCSADAPFQCWRLRYKSCCRYTFSTRSWDGGTQAIFLSKTALMT